MYNHILNDVWLLRLIGIFVVPHSEKEKPTTDFCTLLTSSYILMEAIKFKINIKIF